METTNQYLALDVGRTHYVTYMRHVGYVVVASEKFPHCMLPGMPPYVKHVMCMGQELVLIIDLARFENGVEIKEKTYTYTFIVILAYQGKLAGILTDRVSLLSVQAGMKEELNPITQRMILNFNGENFVMLSVPKFYEEMKERRI